jgi:hypothetical protein
VTEFAKLTKIKVKASMNEKALSVEEGWEVQRGKRVGDQCRVVSWGLVDTIPKRLAFVNEVSHHPIVLQVPKCPTGSTPVLDYVLQSPWVRYVTLKFMVFWGGGLWEELGLHEVMKIGPPGWLQWLYKKRKSRTLVAHACNPSYSGGRDQENHGSKQAQGK